ncbi:MAG: hypothetical protein ACRDRH_10695 [Pseudonocardia sp.]
MHDGRPARGAAIPIHAHGEIDGQLYMEMRLVDAEALEASSR